MGAKSETDLRRERAAQNESVFREVNERIAEVAHSFELQGELLDFICECARTGCNERIHLTSVEYETVRRVPTHFVIARGHEVPEVETVAGWTDRYMVVAKLGTGGERAMKLDRRS
jgi:hypothetical protein